MDHKLDNTKSFNHVISIDTPPMSLSPNGDIPSFLPVKADWQISSPMTSPTNTDYGQHIQVGY